MEFKRINLHICLAPDLLLNNLNPDLCKYCKIQLDAIVNVRIALKQVKFFNLVASHLDEHTLDAALGVSLLNAGWSTLPFD